MTINLDMQKSYKNEEDFSISNHAGALIEWADKKIEYFQNFKKRVIEQCKKNGVEVEPETISKSRNTKKLHISSVSRLVPPDCHV